MSGSAPKGPVGIGIDCLSRELLHPAWIPRTRKKLMKRYNVTPTAAYQYAPAYKRYGHKINAVHFIGPNKPWANLAGRPAGMGVTKGKEAVFDCA